MSRGQRYVSSELSHFVGKGKPEDEQYDILVNKILKSGWLTYPPHDHTLARSLAVDFSKPLSTDEALQYKVVCFCDIPEPDLPIHVDKYSKFGLAFKKDFLIGRGASPVFYVANEAPVSAKQFFAVPEFKSRLEEMVKRRYGDRALMFDTTVRAMMDLFVGLELLNSDVQARLFKGTDISDFEGRLKFLLDLNDSQVAAMKTALKDNKRAFETLKMIMDFVLDYIFSFVKCFDAKRPFDDENNYYMEREWRVANNVQFALSDVSRVFLPASYGARFRAEVPSYSGQVSFID